jgi:Periplasmic copper-binding protein (NosD)
VRFAQTRRGVPILAALVLALACLGSGVAHTSAAGPSFYVDGKHGNDANPGTSLALPFKTIKAGLWALRHGGTLDVVGYDDYVYYETLDATNYFQGGTATSPVVIRAYGYGSAGYVRPIVSGAKVVSVPGQGKWTRTAYPNVWQTPWTTPIAGYEAAVTNYRQERIFVDVSQPLVRPATIPTLAQLQATPGSQYWDGSRLYVRLGGWGSISGQSLDPNAHTIEIPFYKGLLAVTGSSYVQILGFRVRHTTMGVGFTGNAHDNLAQDIDASYNYMMGFWTASYNNTFRRITGTRNTIQLIKLDDGATHNLVDGAVSTENMGQGIRLTGAGNMYNTVQNSVFRGGLDVPAVEAQYGGSVQGIDIEQGANHNTIIGNRIERNQRGLMLYQLSTAGQPLTGNAIRYNMFVGNDTAVFLWDGKFGTTQGTGAVTFYRDTYVSNTRCVLTQAYSSAKTFDHETFYATGSVKTASDSTFYLNQGSITVKDSIIRGSAGYHFYALPGSHVTVTYTALWAQGIATNNSSTTVSFGAGVRTLEPGFLSYDGHSPLYLTIDSRSPTYTVGSSGGPVGARWR